MLTNGNIKAGSCMALLVSSVLAMAHGEKAPAIGYGSFWESKYVSEGRDNLEQGGLFSTEIGAQWDAFAIGAWFAFGDSDAYEELNFFVEYGFTLGALEAYFGYTRLEFTADHESDNEWGGGISYGQLPFITVGIDYTYSTGAGGGFAEVFITSELVLLEGRLVFEPYILEGIDFGYASEAHDGFNNFQAGLGAHYILSDRFALYGSINHTWAHQDVRNDGLGNEAWIALGFSGEF